ncbi:hypothetical protein [Oscillibacter sp. CU971]|uniref:hypothetical protein n=1 Tax=Oscillibacter sp. CU971 TaxID=2780102 RepID=UPI00195A26B9|nr:hypothetical protein [Oscillibacter sp. CU971]
MATKPNIRSIRFSDELAELIDRQAGNTFTEKFENLVTRCVWELPQKEAELKNIQERIDAERKRLYDLHNAAENLMLMERDIKMLRRGLDAVIQRGEAIIEVAKKD